MSHKCLKIRNVWESIYGLGFSIAMYYSKYNLTHMYNGSY